MIVKRRRVDDQPSLDIIPAAKKPKDHGFHTQSPDPDQTTLKMVVGGFYLPKDNTQKPQGEDAHFICADHQTLGVANGVGGWALKGIDAGEYARDLMKNAAIAVYRQPKGSVDPRSVLKEAFQNTKAKGSSTACIATLKDKVLHAVNVGDCGFMLLRNKRFLFKSLPQQRRFNKPFHLGNSSDRPESGVEIKVAVGAGDLVVFGTDGLWDNMYPREIERVIKDKVGEGTLVEPEELAWVIAELALYNSMDKRRKSSFVETAGKSYNGGKIEDITVLVAHIVSC